MKPRQVKKIIQVILKNYKPQASKVEEDYRVVTNAKEQGSTYEKCYVLLGILITLRPSPLLLQSTKRLENAPSAAEAIPTSLQEER